MCTDESAEGAAGSDSDDEVEIGAQSTDFRCPLTASILEDPFTSYVSLSLPALLPSLTFLVE